MSLKVVVFFCLLLVATAERVNPGLSKVKKSMQGRIIGGNEAEPNEFPYVVSLDKVTNHICGGAIINNDWVVTAGHCKDFVPEGGTLRIKAGKHSLSAVENTEQVVNVEKVIIHPKYPGGRVIAAHDIALLKLEKPLVFNAYVQPIALPDPGSDVTGKVVLSGWGFKENGESPDELRRAEFTIIDFDTCQKADIETSGSPSYVTHTNICVGSSDGRFGCAGDSGSPLIQQQGGELKLVGIFSWLANPCGMKGAPSVFTKVSLYNDWIKNTIAENS